MAKIKNTTYRQRVITNAVVGAILGSLLAFLSEFVWLGTSNPLIIIAAFGLAFGILAAIFGDRFWELFLRLRNLLKWL